jgi:hypothetical protein
LLVGTDRKSCAFIGIKRLPRQAIPAVSRGRHGQRLFVLRDSKILSTKRREQYLFISFKNKNRSLAI